MDSLVINVKQLTKRERASLATKVLGHGNKKAAAEATKLHRTTIDKAIDGGNMDPDTLNAIRKFLNAQKVA